jgi:hypothetical protein
MRRPLHWGWLWAAIFLAVGLLDVAVRLVTGWSMTWVVRAEAVLFLSASLANLVIATLALVGGAVVLWRRRARVVG